MSACGRNWPDFYRSKAGLQDFVDRLSAEAAAGIEAVAMDMWPAFEHAVREALPRAAIVFDRFHVMANYSKVIDQVRQSEFKKASADDKHLLKGSRYLLLANAGRLSDGQSERLGELLAANSKLNAVYGLKEQLQQLWHAPTTPADMGRGLDAWCEPPKPPAWRP